MTALRSFKTSERYLTSDTTPHYRRLESSTIRIIRSHKTRMAGHVIVVGQMRDDFFPYIRSKEIAVWIYAHSFAL